VTDIFYIAGKNNKNKE